MKPVKMIIAAFDFDGTITYRDTLIPFLIENNGFLKTIFHIACVLPSFLGFILGLTSRQQVKENLLTKALKGNPIDLIRKKGETFAQEKIIRLIKPEALKKIDWHHTQNHRCILISANLDVYLVPWAELEGFKDVICSKLETDGNGVATGKLVGENCWGPEKARRLQQLLGPKEEYTLYAYGDSRGDHDLLALADHPFYRNFNKEAVHP